MQKIIFLVVSLLSISTYAANDTKNKSEIVAIVNGEKITVENFDQTYKQNLFFVSQKGTSKEKVLKDLINRKIGIQRAKKGKLQNNSVVKRKMEDILYHAQISKDLEPLFKKIAITDEDVKQYYQNHQEYRTAHILLKVRAIPSKEETEAAMNQILDINNMLKAAPEKFSELAAKYSQSSTAPQGGDLGFKPAIQLAPEFFNAIRGKSIGHITTPIRTQFGYHIIKILGVKPFDKIYMPYYKKIVYNIARDAIIDKYFSDLRKEASIKIEKKYLQ